MVSVARFQELMNVPRLLVCQQKVPEPSRVKGAVIVALTGLQVDPPPPPPDVGVRVGLGPTVGVRVRVGVEVRVGVRVGVPPPPPPPPLMLAEKLLTARPPPPIHGSKPICMLVRYHEVVPYWEPRLIASRMKSFALKLMLVMPEPTYETTLFWPLLPVQTVQVLPAVL